MSEFIKIIGQIGGRHSVSTVYEDFLSMSVCAFSMGRMEDRYNEIIKRYDQEEVKLFGDALGALIMEYDKQVDTGGGWNDLLGDFFMEINSKASASNRGQFFTPVSLCDMMAQMTCEGDYKETVNDPTCGSARCLIAHSRLDPQNRFNCFYTGCDLDSRCVNMSVLNYVFFGMKGVVIHMDSLALKVFGGYRIFLPETGLGVKPLSLQECNYYLFSNKSEEEQAPEAEAVIEETSIQVIQQKTPQFNEQLKLF